MAKNITKIVALAILLALSGCGGGSGGPTLVVSPAPPVTETPSGPPLVGPSNSWTPRAGTTPQSGNYVYLESEKSAVARETVGDGESYLYVETDNSTQVNIKGAEGALMLFVQDHAKKQTWLGGFAGTDNSKQLQAGYYTDVLEYSIINWKSNRMGVSNLTLSRSCDRSAGWFAIDHIEYATNGRVIALDLRFEQRCNGSDLALHGKVHWIYTIPPTPEPGPIAPPLNLWRADPAKLPTGPENYVYLTSDAGDFIGDENRRATSQLYTSMDALFEVVPLPRTNGVEFRVDGDRDWFGQFAARAALTKMQPGYYGDMGDTDDPVRGFMSWNGDGRAAELMTGARYQNWFVIDSISYAGDVLTAIELRFEQHDNGDHPALRGQIRWRANDQSKPPGPVYPIPETVWRPPAGAMPATGNAAYLQSEAGDYIGQGATYLYTSTNATFQVWMRPEGAEFRIIDNDDWIGTFIPPVHLSQLVPGYYAGVQGVGSINHAKGAMAWGGHGRGCNFSSGWFAIDKVTYSGAMLIELEARFEQHCEGDTPSMRGAIRWKGTSLMGLTMQR